MAERISVKHVRELFRLACKDTWNLPNNSDALTGFVVGMRAYERLANLMDRAIPNSVIASILRKTRKGRGGA